MLPGCVLALFCLATCFAGDGAAESGRTQNSLLRVVPAPGAVTVDARLEDWDRSGRIFICSELATQQETKSALVSAMYDTQAIYLALEVNDPTPLQNKTDPSKPADAWRQDCVQMRFRLPAKNGGQIVFADTWFYSPEEKPVLHLSPQKPRGERIDVLAAGGETAFRKNDDNAGYVQEIRIPWTLLGVDAAAIEPDFSFRMGVEVYGGEYGTPEGFRLADLIARRGTSTQSFFAHPERWGRAQLMEKGSLQVADYQTMPVHITEHPFLICRREQFPALIARSTKEPWATMAAAAKKRCADGLTRPGHAYSLTRHIGACALVYILEEDKRKENAQRVKDAILHLEEIEFDAGKSWTGVVPPLGSAFVAILALDIVYDDLSTGEIRDCEALIEEQTGKIDRHGAWPAARLGTFGTWDIYRGERILPDDAFFDNYMRQMTADGVTTVSPGYAFARLGSGDGRPQKTGYADVLEFTGIDNRYYNNERLRSFYRWLFSASVNPAKEYHLFGDVAPGWNPPNSALMWRVGRFDEKAAAYAAWLLDGKEPPGHILSFILMQDPLPEAVVPGSRLFMQGGAVFREPQDDPLALACALYNIVGRPDWHTHEEVNALSASAYGNRLLVNGGWLGEAMRPPAKNNTLAIDGRPHATRIGAGLEEGILAEGFDYACGVSGGALGDDSFRRSLIMVHPQDGAAGYFVTIDEVDADNGEAVHSYLQLASESAAEEVRVRQEYLAAIDHHAEVDGVKLSVFYEPQPAQVKQAKVASGFLERSPQSGYHYRLEAVCPTNEKGNLNAITVLFPHNGKHPKATMVPGDADTEACVLVRQAGEVTDVIASSSDEQAREIEGCAIRARAALFRHTSGTPVFYFARQGTEFESGGIGFRSAKPVSLYMRGTFGHIAGPGCEVTFRQPGLESVSIDEEPVEAVGKGDGFVRVAVPRGSHAIMLR
jgi:hypothetical protein